MKKTVLITGVAGLLGSRLADWIIENKPEYEVVGVDDLSGGFAQNINSKVKFWHIDLTDNTDIEHCFKVHKPDYVFHFAAYAAEGLSPFIRCYNYDNNLKSTARIVNECIKHDVKRLVFTSTLAVYGHGDGGIFDESQRQSPIDPYGVAKYACEMDIQIAGEQHGLDWCIVRPHNVYGIKQNIWDKYRNVLNDANKLLCKVIGEDAEVQHLEGRHEVKHSIPTYQKSVDILGFKYKTSMVDGLTQMWEWAQKQPMRDRFVWPNYELDKGIYSFWKNESKESNK